MIPKDLKVDEVIDNLIDFYKVTYWMYLIHTKLDKEKIKAMIEENKGEINKWNSMLEDPKYFDREYAYSQIRTLEAEIEELLDYQDVDDSEKFLKPKE